MKQVDLSSFELREIKSQGITNQELQELHALSGSYESLLNKRSQLYKSQGLKDKKLSEAQIKELILEHYTFLKRPVFQIGEKLFIGNSKATIEDLLRELSLN